MLSSTTITSKWIKAAVLGTVWAASEIVLGSFLHNIRMPFSGNMLVGVAMILLISASHLWTEKGIIWRSGLICALLKTLSPSAIIFGPMVAIFMEGVLLESAVYIFKRKKIGFIVGAALAMSWNLVHKIINMVFYYGMDIIKVYEKLMRSAQKKLHWDFDIVWVPLATLLIIYIILGIIAALIGIKIGKNLLDDNYNPTFLEVKFSTKSHFITQSKSFNYSIFWLIANLFLPIAIMISKNYIRFEYWIMLVVVLVAFWSFRYKRAMRQVAKPKFWIWFVLITMLTTLLFTDTDTTKGITEGLKIGVTMNLRAILLVVTFTVLGTELYNPKIKEYLMKGRFKQLSLAVALSLESLPSTIANIPDFKTIFKNPTIVFYQVIWHANERLKDLLGTEK
ncbi:MAG: hypothetical protein V3U80_10185 [Flavobacteriaceae bacterium]